MFKVFCDKKDCEIQIQDGEDFGTFTNFSKEIIFHPKSHQALPPQLRKKEFHLCPKHAKEILEFLERKDEDLK